MFTGIGLFLKAVPLWVWVALALLAAGLFYGHTRYNAGQADVQGKFDTHLAADKEATRKANEANRAKEAEERKDVATAIQNRDKALTDAQNREKALTADLIAERRRVRDFWRGGDCPVSGDHAADRSGESAEGLRAAAVGRIAGIGGEAETDYAYLVERYTAAEKACPLTEKP